MKALAQGQYPDYELSRHQAQFGSVEDVVDADIVTIIQRAILTLDYIETNPSNRSAHLDAFRTHLLPALQNTPLNNATYEPTFVASLEFRFERLSNPIYLVPGPGGSGSQSGAFSDYQNPTVASVEDCDEFEAGFNYYCGNPAFQTFIVTEVSGGSSEFVDLEQFMRTLDWSKYQSQQQLNQALIESGFDAQTIQQFSNTFGANDSQSVLLERFNSQEQLILANPRFYLLQNAKNIEALQLQNIAPQLR